MCSHHLVAASSLALGADTRPAGSSDDPSAIWRAFDDQHGVHKKFRFRGLSVHPNR